ncbi:mediator of RNA polymerase II transcription subunit 12-like [Helianthus annuus]|uniref:mediator of RNA polymerase II transcription subunit 12-like n=1 Tax=Helianthus annuus TaxID=4232 RepID=UPI000B9059E4|nr:mediator of RNA polymerase II transcription subunit 12-like [Helianthus annuus]XP_035835077.1 mediator of RNA polymerase II transcription subunit 12-like [Helianthus annuus]
MGPVWLRFFSIKHPQYRELCLEFLSTYEFQTPCTDYSYGRSITFRMAGVERSCSLIEFAKRMGLYTDKEMKTDVFLKGLIKLPDAVTPEQVWAQIGEGPYQAKPLIYTRLKDPFHRILHRVIALSIAGRKCGPNVIFQKDLFFLYCLIKPAVCNVAYMLASYFTSCMGMRPTTYICGGSYITQLAKSYGVLTPEACDNLTSFLPTQTLDMVALTYMKVVEPISQPDPSQHKEAPQQQQHPSQHQAAHQEQHEAAHQEQHEAAHQEQHEEAPQQQHSPHHEEAPQQQPQGAAPQQQQHPSQHQEAPQEQHEEAPQPQHSPHHEEAPHLQYPPLHEEAPDQQHLMKQEDPPEQQHPLQQEEGPEQHQADPLTHGLGVTTVDLVAMMAELQQGQQRLEQEHQRVEQENQRRHQETMSALRCIARHFAIPEFPPP